MPDKFAGWGGRLDSPASGAAAVVPNDAADLPISSRGVYIGTAGDVSVVMVDGQSVLFKAALAGTTLPIRVARVKATGTTATNLIAVW